MSNTYCSSQRYGWPRGEKVLSLLPKRYILDSLSFKLYIMIADCNTWYFFARLQNPRINYYLKIRRFLRLMRSCFLERAPFGLNRSLANVRRTDGILPLARPHTSRFFLPGYLAMPSSRPLTCGVVRNPPPKVIFINTVNDLILKYMTT